MLESRWGRRLGPGAAALAGVLVILTTSVGPATAEGRPPPDCPATTTVGAIPDGSPWFRLEPTLVAGRRTGQQLAFGQGRGRAWAMTLGAESFATGPRGGQVVVGTDDGRRSTISVVDTTRGCRSAVATVADIVRSAVLAADGRTLFEHRVARSDRHDLGIWRRASDMEAIRVLPAPDVDPAFGRTWLTELHWSGRRLVVASCGEVACRFRELDPWSGAVRTLADPSLGSLVGVAGDALIVRGACRGLPCPVLRVDVSDGVATTLVDAAGPARVAVDGSGSDVIVVAAPDGHDIRAVDLDGTVTTLPPVDAGADLAAAVPELGVELPPGWIPLLGSDGPIARRLDTALPVRFDEVRP